MKCVGVAPPAPGRAVTPAQARTARTMLYPAGKVETRVASGATPVAVPIVTVVTKEVSDLEQVGGKSVTGATLTVPSPDKNTTLSNSELKMVSVEDGTAQDLGNNKVAGATTKGKTDTKTAAARRKASVAKQAVETATRERAEAKIAAARRKASAAKQAVDTATRERAEAKIATARRKASAAESVRMAEEIQIRATAKVKKARVAAEQEEASRKAAEQAEAAKRTAADEAAEHEATLRETAAEADEAEATRIAEEIEIRAAVQTEIEEKRIKHRTARAAASKTPRKGATSGKEAAVKAKEMDDIETARVGTAEIKPRARMVIGEQIENKVEAAEAEAARGRVKPRGGWGKKPAAKPLEKVNCKHCPCKNIKNEPVGDHESWKRYWALRCMETEHKICKVCEQDAGRCEECGVSGDRVGDSEALTMGKIPDELVQLHLEEEDAEMSRKGEQPRCNPGAQQTQTPHSSVSEEEDNLAHKDRILEQHVDESVEEYRSRRARGIVKKLERTCGVCKVRFNPEQKARRPTNRRCGHVICVECAAMETLKEVASILLKAARCEPTVIGRLFETEVLTPELVEYKGQSTEEVLMGTSAVIVDKGSTVVGIGCSSCAMCSHSVKECTPGTDHHGNHLSFTVLKVHQYTRKQYGCGRPELTAFAKDLVWAADDGEVSEDSTIEKAESKVLELSSKCNSLDTVAVLWHTLSKIASASHVDAREIYASVVLLHTNGLHFSVTGRTEVWNPVSYSMAHPRIRVMNAVVHLMLSLKCSVERETKDGTPLEGPFGITQADEALGAIQLGVAAQGCPLGYCNNCDEGQQHRRQPKQCAPGILRVLMRNNSMAVVLDGIQNLRSRPELTCVDGVQQYTEQSLANATHPCCAFDGMRGDLEDWREHVLKLGGLQLLGGLPQDTDSEIHNRTVRFLAGKGGSGIMTHADTSEARGMCVERELTPEEHVILCKLVDTEQGPNYELDANSEQNVESGFTKLQVAHYSEVQDAVMVQAAHIGLVIGSQVWAEVLVACEGARVGIDSPGIAECGVGSPYSLVWEDSFAGRRLAESVRIICGTSLSTPREYTSGLLRVRQRIEHVDVNMGREDKRCKKTKIGHVRTPDGGVCSDGAKPRGGSDRCSSVMASPDLGATMNPAPTGYKSGSQSQLQQQQGSPTVYKSGSQAQPRLKQNSREEDQQGQSNQPYRTYVNHQHHAFMQRQQQQPWQQGRPNQTNGRTGHVNQRNQNQVHYSNRNRDERQIQREPSTFAVRFQGENVPPPPGNEVDVPPPPPPPPVLSTERAGDVRMSPKMSKVSTKEGHMDSGEDEEAGVNSEDYNKIQRFASVQSSVLDIVSNCTEEELNQRKELQQTKGSDVKDAVVIQTPSATQEFTALFVKQVNKLRVEEVVELEYTASGVTVVRIVSKNKVQTARTGTCADRYMALTAALQHVKGEILSDSETLVTTTHMQQKCGVAALNSLPETTNVSRWPQLHKDTAQSMEPWTVSAIIDQALIMVGAIVVTVRTRAGLYTYGAAHNQATQSGVPIQMVTLLMIDVLGNINRCTGMMVPSTKRSAAHVEVLLVPATEQDNRAAVYRLWYNASREGGSWIEGNTAAELIPQLKESIVQTLVREATEQVGRAMQRHAEHTVKRSRFSTDTLVDWEEVHEKIGKGVLSLPVTMQSTVEGTEGEQEVSQSNEESGMESQEEDCEGEEQQGDMTVEHITFITVIRDNIIELLSHASVLRLSEQSMIPIWQIPPKMVRRLLEEIRRSNPVTHQMTTAQLITALDQGLVIESKVLLWKGLQAEVMLQDLEDTAQTYREEGYVVTTLVTANEESLYAVTLGVEVALRAGYWSSESRLEETDIKRLVSEVPFYLGIIPRVANDRKAEIEQYTKKNIIKGQQERELFRVAKAHCSVAPCHRDNCECVSATGMMGKYCCAKCKEGIECEVLHSFPQHMTEEPGEQPTVATCEETGQIESISVLDVDKTRALEKEVERLKDEVKRQRDRSREQTEHHQTLLQQLDKERDATSRERNENQIRTDEIRNSEKQIGKLEAEVERLNATNGSEELQEITVQNRVNEIVQGRDKDQKRINNKKQQRMAAVQADIIMIRSELPNTPPTSAAIIHSLRTLVCGEHTIQDYECQNDTFTTELMDRLAGRRQEEVKQIRTLLQISGDDVHEVRSLLSQVSYAQGDIVHWWPDRSGGGALMVQESPMKLQISQIIQSEEGLQYVLTNGEVTTSRELLPGCIRKVVEDTEVLGAERYEYRALLDTLSHVREEAITVLQEQEMGHPNDTLLTAAKDRMIAAGSMTPTGLCRELSILVTDTLSILTEQSDCARCEVKGGELLCKACAVQIKLECEGCRQALNEVGNDMPMFCGRCTDVMCEDRRIQWSKEAITQYKESMVDSQMRAVFWLVSEVTGQAFMVRNVVTVGGAELYITHSADAINTMTICDKKHIQDMCQDEEDDYKIVNDAMAVGEALGYNSADTEVLAAEGHRAIDQYICLGTRDLYGDDRIVLGLQDSGKCRRVEAVSIIQSKQPVRGGEQLWGWRGDRKQIFQKSKVVVMERVDSDNLDHEDLESELFSVDSAGHGETAWMEEEGEAPQGSFGALLHSAQRTLNARASRRDMRPVQDELSGAIHMQHDMRQHETQSTGDIVSKTMPRSAQQSPSEQVVTEVIPDQFLIPGPQQPLQYGATMRNAHYPTQSTVSAPVDPHTRTARYGYPNGQQTQAAVTSPMSMHNESGSKNHQAAPEHRSHIPPYMSSPPACSAETQGNQQYPPPHGMSGGYTRAPTVTPAPYATQGHPNYSPGSQHSNGLSHNSGCSSYEETIRLVQSMMPRVDTQPVSGTVPITDASADTAAVLQYVEWNDCLEKVVTPELLGSLPSALWNQAITPLVTVDYMITRVRAVTEEAGVRVETLPELLWNEIMEADWADRNVVLQKARWRTPALKEAGSSAVRKYIGACYHIMSQKDPNSSTDAAKMGQQFVLDVGFPTQAKSLSYWVRGLAEGYSNSYKRDFWRLQTDTAMKGFLDAAAGYRGFVSALVADTANDIYTNTEYMMYAEWVRSHGTTALARKLKTAPSGYKQTTTRTDKIRPNTRKVSFGAKTGAASVAVAEEAIEEEVEQIYYNESTANTVQPGTQYQSIKGEGGTFYAPAPLDYSTPEGIAQFPDQFRAFWAQFNMDPDSPDGKIDVTSGRRGDEKTPFDWTLPQECQVLKSPQFMQGPCWLHRTRSMSWQNGGWHRACDCTAEHAPTAGSELNTFSASDRTAIGAMPWEERRLYVQAETLKRNTGTSDKQLFSMEECMFEEEMMFRAERVDGTGANEGKM